MANARTPCKSSSDSIRASLAVTRLGSNPAAAKAFPSALSGSVGNMTVPSGSGVTLYLASRRSWSVAGPDLDAVVTDSSPSFAEFGCRIAGPGTGEQRIRIARSGTQCGPGRLRQARTRSRIPPSLIRRRVPGESRGYPPPTFPCGAGLRKRETWSDHPAGERSGPISSQGRRSRLERFGDDVHRVNIAGPEGAGMARRKIRHAVGCSADS